MNYTTINIGLRANAAKVWLLNFVYFSSTLKLKQENVEGLKQPKQHYQPALRMSHDPKSQANVNNTTNCPYLKELKMHKRTVQIFDDWYQHQYAPF